MGVIPESEEPARLIVGMGMENWEKVGMGRYAKNGYGCGYWFGIGITHLILVPAPYLNFLG